jgi:hypothetical protein
VGNVVCDEAPGSVAAAAGSVTEGPQTAPPRPVTCVRFEDPPVFQQPFQMAALCPPSFFGESAPQISQGFFGRAVMRSRALLFLGAWLLKWVLIVKAACFFRAVISQPSIISTIACSCLCARILAGHP